MKVRLVEAMCIRWMRGADHSRSAPLERCALATASEASVSIDREIADVLDYVGDTDVVVVVLLEGRSSRPPAVERE